MFDRESAKRVDNTIQDSLFIMAVSNSCMNPLVYGSYAMKFQYCPCSKKKEKKIIGSNYNYKMELQRRSTGKQGESATDPFTSSDLHLVFSAI